MSKKIILFGTAVSLMAVIVSIHWWQKDDVLSKQPPSSEHFEVKSVEELREEMSAVARYEFEHGCVEEDDRGMEVFCGESKTRVDKAEALYRKALEEQMTPNEQIQQADMSAIRKFMGDVELGLKYAQSRPSVNFNVGVVTSLSSEGDSRTETPKGWERTVNVYVTTEEIEGACEIYEYEVYPDTHDVVQVHVVYPEGYQGQCSKGNLFSSRATDQDISATGWGYLERAISNIDQFRSEITVQPLARAEENPSRWEWKWEDASYQLPDGLSGSSAVDSRPTIRLHISSAGKLLQYNNTVPLFK